MAKYGFWYLTLITGCFSFLAFLNSRALIRNAAQPDCLDILSDLRGIVGLERISNMYVLQVEMKGKNVRGYKLASPARVKVSTSPKNIYTTKVRFLKLSFVALEYR